MATIAVIPARGGSKRIPRKNIKPFAGKPMIGYAIGAAQQSGLFDRIVVSTDDAEIAEVAKQLGAHVPFKRPAHLADDQTVTVPVIAHAVEAMQAMGTDVQAACCIYPCVPLLRAEDLQAAHKQFVESGAPFVYPVVEFHSSPLRSMRQLPSGQMQFRYPEHELTRTQDLERCYFDAGQFYWGRADAWKAQMRMHSNGHGYVVPGYRIVDIDNDDDWKRAELLYQLLAG